MLQEVLSLIQDTEVLYEIRQGVRFEIELVWLDDQNQPRDITGQTFLAQMRDGYAADAGLVVANFALTPDVNGNVYTVDVPTATTVFTFDQRTAAAMAPDRAYYFEAKLIDTGGEAIDSFQAQITARKDVARV